MKQKRESFVLVTSDSSLPNAHHVTSSLYKRYGVSAERHASLRRRHDNIEQRDVDK